MNELQLQYLFGLGLILFTFGCGEKISQTAGTIAYHSLSHVPSDHIVEIFHSTNEDPAQKCHKLLSNPKVLPAGLKLGNSNTIFELANEERSHFLLEHLDSRLRYLIFIRVLSPDRSQILLAGCAQNIAVQPGKLGDIDIRLFPLTTSVDEVKS